jgi:hypothetical protein
MWRGERVLAEQIVKIKQRWKISPDGPFKLYARCPLSIYIPCVRLKTGNVLDSVALDTNPSNTHSAPNSRGGGGGGE